MNSPIGSIAGLICLGCAVPFVLVYAALVAGGRADEYAQAIAAAIDFDFQDDAGDEL